MTRSYDLVIHGATGVTGREAVRHLLGSHPEEPKRWAVAGRSPERLAALLRDLAPGRSIDVITADACDAESVERLVADTRVVLNFAGPYARLGEPFVSACAEHGTDYLDLTGEIPWVMRMIERYHEPARASGAKIVFTAGYEALPFDLGALFVVDAIRTRFGEGTARVEVVARIHGNAGRRTRDFVSGGTVASLKEMLEAGEGAGLDDPACLMPEGSDRESVRERNPYVLGARHLDALDVWVGPLFPAPFINPPVIHRSRALLEAAGTRYGARFSYREGTAMDGFTRNPSAQRLAAQLAGALSQGQLALTRSGGPWLRGALRRALDVVMPQPGEGPSEAAMAGLDWSLELLGASDSGRRLRARLTGTGHPGYRSTAKMLVESGRALALDGERLPPIHGCVTPAAALGLGALERLRGAGLRFELDPA